MKLSDLLNKNYIDVKVISLKSQDDRRRKIDEVFRKHNVKYSFINAIDGRLLLAADYYKFSKNSYRRALSPGELGCSLSHQLAYHELVNSNFDYSLILEDDVIFNKESYLDFEFDEKLLQDNIFFMGGQEGLRRPLLLSAVRSSRFNIYKSLLPAKLLQRTCCYIISKKCAQEVINLWKKKAFLADDWYYILSHTSYTGIVYFPLFSHPVDLSDSTIENERG